MRSKTILTITLFGLLFVEYGCVSRLPYTMENNPTKTAGRGEPSFDDEFRPAAWVLIDGHEGTFKEVDGHPQVQWVVSEPVSSTPTFRVEVIEPLLGNPSEFKCVLRTVEAVDGSDITYGIASEDGKFKAGRDYSLLSPGDGFVILERPTLDIVQQIEPLAPGRYMIAAGIKNPESNKTALAVTYFTVAETQ